MLYSSVQKAIYKDVFPNVKIALPLDKAITQRQAAVFVNMGLGINLAYQDAALVDTARLDAVLNDISRAKTASSQDEVTNDNVVTEDILFQDIYQRLKTDYIDADALTDEKLLYGATKGLTEATKDPYTTFYNPTDAKQFTDEMAGEFEGIGAYVEMKTAGVFIITSPISGSPAEAAGILPKDQIVQVDDHKVTEEVDVDTII
ncbi:MAG: PDZ domain-containing protein [bacterium]